MQSNPYGVDRPGPHMDLPGDPSKGAVAYLLATQLPAACGVPKPDLQQVWTHEWDDEGETWGIALNGTGRYRMWFGSMHTLDTEQTFSVEHPAGTAVVGIDQEALGVLKPDANEWFCEKEEIPIWEQATMHALHDRLLELNHDVPSIEELLETADRGGEP